MDGTHGAHELLETTAALILSIGGGLILVRAFLARHNGPAAPSEAVSASRSETFHRSSRLAIVRRAERILAAGLCLAAGFIHLAAGPSHLEELGLLGLGFYGAAIFQMILAIVIVNRSGVPAVAWLGIAGNVALIGAWAWSRSVGLPGNGGGPEGMGLADLTTVVLEASLISVLGLRLARLDTRLLAGRSAASLGSVATAGLVAVLGVIALSATIAVSDVMGAHEAHPSSHAPARVGP